MKNKIFIFVFSLFFVFGLAESVNATTYFYDEFDVSLSTNLSGRTPDLGTSWSQLINNGRSLYVYSYRDFITTQSNGENMGTLYQANGTYPTADYEVLYRIAFSGGDWNYTRSVAARIQDANNMYLLRQGYGSSGLQIYKRTSGAWTLLGSTSYYPVSDTTAPYNDAGDIVGIRVEGNNISALVNDEVKLTVTDSDHTLAGVAGIGTGYVNVSSDDSGTGVGIDNFTVRSLGDYSNPVVADLTPADNATGVVLDSNFVITFNEDVATSTGNIYIYKTSNDSLVDTIDVTGSQITASGTTAFVINPNITLTSNTEYYFNIDATAIDDVSGNSYAGITASTTWSFITVDNVAPSISTLSPADNSSDIAIDSNLVITFDEDVATNTGNFYIRKTSDDSVFETFNVASSTVTASGTTAFVLNPGSDFSSETSYYVNIDATAIDDISGNSFLGVSSASTWNFTSADVNNPSVSVLSPADNTTDVAITSNLVMTFDEIVDAELGNIVLYKTSDDSVVESFDVNSDISGSGTVEITINPASDLVYKTEYYVIVPATAFDDVAGNSYAGITASTTWSFITADTPTCTTVTNAATYNDYPTCGVATCDNGYTLSAGICVSNGSNSIPIPAPSSGIGETSVLVPMGTKRQLGPVTPQGINIMTYVNSVSSFKTTVSNFGKNVPQEHSIEIADLDLLNNIITLVIKSEPQIVTFNLGETKEVDLDNDGIKDIKIKFEDIVINRAELTVQSSLKEVDSEKVVEVLSDKDDDVLIKYQDSPKVYLLKNGKKRWIYDEETFNYFGYNWSNLLLISKDNQYPDGPILIIPEGEIVNTKFSRDLYLGINGEDVKALQIYLNTNGFIVAESSYGSIGNETEVFGPATQRALIKYQIVNNITPAQGYFGPLTRDLIK